jgi:hypothetical protein
MRPGSACRANRDVPLKQRRVGVTAADRDRDAVATRSEPTAQAKGHLSVTDVHVPREDPVAASIDRERRDLRRAGGRPGAGREEQRARQRAGRGVLADDLAGRSLRSGRPGRPARAGLTLRSGLALRSGRSGRSGRPRLAGLPVLAGLSVLARLPVLARRAGLALRSLRSGRPGLTRRAGLTLRPLRSGRPRLSVGQLRRCLTARPWPSRWDRSSRR